MDEILLGQVVGHYRVLRKLGEGGMGEVYLAVDTRLGRQVAMKLLPEKYFDDSEAKERFQREARAASALNHPNICTVYDIGEHSKQPFIVMEYLEGRTLYETLEGQPVEVERVLKTGAQLADALKAAHAKSIIHRDIKPTNIFLTEDGGLRILDFGLAKLVGGQVSPASQMPTSHLSPSALTTPGSPVGTVTYMSPEQATGDNLDQRTDLFSLGVVLYEMATGALPFQGKTVAVVFKEILTGEPAPPRQLNPRIPYELSRILHKALQKDPEVRYQTAAGLLADLRLLQQTGGAPLVPLSPEKRRDYWKPVSLLLGILLLLSLVVTWSLWTQSASTGVVEREAAGASALVRLTFERGLETQPTWSADGEQIAFASDRNGNLDIWLLDIDGGAPVQVTRDPANDQSPSWSPDGRILAFSSDRDGGGIFLVRPQEDAEVTPLTGYGRDPVWSPDGSRLAFHWQGEIHIVGVTGGEPESVFAGISSRPHLAWTPDGQSLLFWNRTAGDIQVYSLADESLATLGLIPAGQQVAGIALSGNRMYFSRGPFGGAKDLWVVSLDSTGSGVVGQPEVLLRSITDDVECAVSQDGRKLVFAARRIQRNLWVDRMGEGEEGLPEGRPRLLTAGADLNYYPTFSPSGERLLWTSHRGGQGLLFCRDLVREKTEKVTGAWGRQIREIGASFFGRDEQIVYSTTSRGSYELARVSFPGAVEIPLTETEHPLRDSHTAASLENDEVYFQTNRSGTWDIWSISGSSGGEPKRVTDWPGNELHPKCAPDGNFLAFSSDRNGNLDIWVKDLQSGEVSVFEEGRATEAWSDWSKDGKWLYFTTDRSGMFEIWRKRFPGNSPAVPVVDDDSVPLRLPEEALFTKFAVSSSMLVFPVEVRTGDIYVVEGLEVE